MKKNILIAVAVIASLGSLYYIQGFSLKDTVEDVGHAASSVGETVGKGVADVLSTGRGQFGPVGVAFTFECAEAKKHWKYPTNANIPTLNKKYCRGGSSKNQPPVVALDALFISVVKTKLIPLINGIISQRSGYNRNSKQWHDLNAVVSPLEQLAKMMYQKGTGQSLTAIWGDRRSEFYLNENPQKLASYNVVPFESYKVDVYHYIYNLKANLWNLWKNSTALSYQEKQDIARTFPIFDAAMEIIMPGSSAAWK